MRKAIIFIMLALAFISLSGVFAAENATDIEADAVNEEIVIPDISDQDIVANESGSDAEIIKADSKISASSAVGYEKFSTKMTVKLTSNGTALPSKDVIINLNGKNYTKTTNSAGKASLSVSLPKGKYVATCYFLGDDDTNPSKATAGVTVKAPVKTVFKVADKSISYRQGSKSVFVVRLLKSSGAALKNQKVTFKINGKTYDKHTSSKGYAQIFINLKKGKHKIAYSFKAKAPYLASKGTTKINVKAPMGKGNGYWMLYTEMKTANLKTLKSLGTKQIFLHSYAVDAYGKSAVSSWIKQANKYGMKVHLWMQVFYDYYGNWIKPIKKDGSPNYALMKNKAHNIVKYAKISGVSGIYLDYVRFAGTALNYDNSVKAINYFVKKVCTEIRNVRPNCIISAAVMPEPGMTEYYYGQDIPTMSKYLDVIIPMAYKGNYGKKNTWITYVTKAFTLESNGAQVWTGIQSYKSDDNEVLLSPSVLLKDAKSAVSGGAKGVVIFRYGFTKLLNFNKV